MWFLPSVSEGVGLQITYLSERLAALRAVVLLNSIVGLLMMPKAISASKSLWALVTRLQTLHC